MLLLWMLQFWRVRATCGGPMAFRGAVRLLFAEAGGHYDYPSPCSAISNATVAKAFQVFESGDPERKTETQLSLPLVHYPDTCNSQGWPAETQSSLP